MKKIFNIGSRRFRRSVAVLSAVAVVCCIGVVNSRMQSANNLSVSAGYEEYENREMEEHNGEVLVDSLNLKGVEGSSEKQDKGDENNKDGKNKDEKTSMVTSDSAAAIENTDEYFREARETLTYDRNEMISMLTDTIESKEAGAEKASASQQKTKLMEYMEMEKNTESLIRNKGYSDAFVIVTDRSVNVTVQAEKLDENDIAKILDTVMRETGRKAEDIVIQPKSK